jgi:diguanylate cyclase (GGDEF)-like protein
MDEVALIRHISETQRLINSVSPDQIQIMQVVSERAQSITAADSAMVELVEGDHMVYRAVSGRALDALCTRLRVASSLSGRCVRLGVPMRCADTETDTRVDRASCHQLGIRSMVIVPLMQGDFPVGVLKVASNEPDHFRESDLEVLQEMAGFIAESLGNASDDVEESRYALHDGLTGLANRHLLVDRLEAACLRADENGTTLAVFVIELDGFELVKDGFGRAAGDDALRIVARGLSEATRASDVLARLGEEEFVLVCEHVDHAGAEQIVGRVAEVVQRVAVSEPRLHDIGASVGMAWRDAHHRSADELLSAANAAMYRVRRSG